MPERSTTHLVLIPSYNPGERVCATVQAALDAWRPVWVIVDGSTDGSAERLAAMAAREPDLKVLALPQNRGKGAALLLGMREASANGYTHALTMDADGQHPADRIGAFMRASSAHPAAMILGNPIFDASAPRVRVEGRKICNWATNLETLYAGIGDSLFGFRVYPLRPLIELMLARRWMRGFDFEAEAAVRLCWEGVQPINLPAPVRYYRPSEGGVSHFNYWRDNALLIWMHLRLICALPRRLPTLIARRLRRRG